MKSTYHYKDLEISNAKDFKSILEAAREYALIQVQDEVNRLEWRQIQKQLNQIINNIPCDHLGSIKTEPHGFYCGKCDIRLKDAT